MAYELTVKKSGTFQNARLEELTNEMASAISAVGAMAERTRVLCARNLNTIEKDELYKADGFESAKDFAKSVMGMSESNAYAYLQVGRALNLEQIPTQDANGKDFTFTQLRSLCAVKDTKKLTEAVNAGELNADQTANDMDETVKAINPAKKPRKPVAEKRYTWEEVGTGEESAEASKTELLSTISANNGVFLGELKADDDLYIVAIGEDGYPLLYRRGTEVKKVVEAN